MVASDCKPSRHQVKSLQCSSVLLTKKMRAVVSQYVLAEDVSMGAPVEAASIRSRVQLHNVAVVTAQRSICHVEKKGWIEQQDWCIRIRLP